MKAAKNMSEKEINDFLKKNNYEPNYFSLTQKQAIVNILLIKQIANGEIK